MAIGLHVVVRELTIDVDDHLKLGDCSSIQRRWLDYDKLARKAVWHGSTEDVSLLTAPQLAGDMDLSGKPPHSGLTSSLSIQQLLPPTSYRFNSTASYAGPHNLAQSAVRWLWQHKVAR